jgi:carbonic anhydrase
MSSAQNSGQYQSPIDISRVAGSASLSVRFNYAPTPLHILNTGHTVQVNPQAGSYLEVEARRYDLKQFHFHTPSEHMVAGQQYDMEAHLVHESPGGELVVVGLLFQLDEENGLLHTLLECIPLESGRERQYQEVVIDPGTMIPSAGKFYTYGGSLTTPPYTEGVLWFLLQELQPVSQAQLDQFSSLFGPNARVVQPLHERVVLEGRLS